MKMLWPKLILFIFLPFLTHSQNLRIYHIDVDQADATLFIAPDGSSLLVDSGKNGHGARVKRVMDQAGITRINHFVATHYHEDHYGGIDDLIRDQGVQVLQAFDRGDKNSLPARTTNSKSYEGYDTIIGHRAIEITRGMVIQVDPEVTATCISKGGVVLSEANPTTGHDENDMSVSLLVEYGSFRYFVGGDIERATERKIANVDVVMDVDVYQANHHGSHSSSSWNFVQDLHPSVVVISNGNRTDYGHPLS